MLTATVTSHKETNGNYGPQVECFLTLNDGKNTKKKAWIKADHPTAFNIVDGCTVELKPKDNGKGYFIQSVIEGQSQQVQQTAPSQPSQNGTSPKDISKYIEAAAIRYAEAMKHIKEECEKNGIPITENILRSGAATVFIAMKDKFNL